MLILIIGFAVYFGVRGVRAALASLAQLPRSNADWVWY